MNTFKDTQPEIRAGAVIRVHLGEKPFEKTVIGDGWRLLVVASAGRARVTLLNPATLRHLKTSRALIAMIGYDIVAGRSSRVARRIRARARDFKKLEVGYPKATVRDALAALAGASA